MIQMDDNDRYSLALCIYKEARGDGAGAMHAVAHVILNRCGAPGFPKNIHDVIYQKNAFSSMSVPSDAEFNLQPTPLDNSWKDAVYIVSNLPDDDETKGARWYANLKTATSGWFTENIVNCPEQHPVTLVYKNHTFFA